MAIHKVYEELNVHEKETVDISFDMIATYIRAKGFKSAMDDRAERLVEAIAVFLKESNKS